MTSPIDFAQPWALVLLPLALLPLLRRRGDTLSFSHVAWLPADRAGRVIGVLWRACAVLTIIAIVIGLAGPGRSNLQVLRTGTGAEILILMDRSSSMDDTMGRQPIDTRGMSKNEVARHSLTRFVDERPNDRLAFMMFGISPVPVVRFTANHEIIQEAIAGTGIGRGMPDTQLDRGLRAGIGQFDGRRYEARRAIVFVSDGGARLDAQARRDIEDGLARNQIDLYFIYLRSGVYSPDLRAIAANDTSEEAELQRFFVTLKSPYHLYQAGDADAMAEAMADINRRQKSEVSFVEQLPRQDRSAWCYAAALVSCVLLLALHTIQVRSWA
ncbi:VWA domain-containing protein [Caballeronia sp. SEWSISQ10-4 2]|uniref:vWA domain-containing protein n=1 Tax=Caballeronia sp. SEWSISQ10-4 2 TaxID=2937438 RepID=UPI002651C7C8|nr:vWA domain-containing protein [Caballeronia sp. SEWSISQ10-4 2]MDN7181882.1 VWA domain-containing protein [Caballeronia sp. SEWSISQ10-4 2]